MAIVDLNTPDIGTATSLREAARIDALVRRFAAATDAFCVMAAAEGIAVKAYDRSSGEPTHFRRMPVERQERILDRFLEYVATCESVLAANGKLRDDRRLIWAAMTRMNLRPPSDLFAMLGDEDYIEIFDGSDHVQVFRNLRYYQVTSYTLDDLLCRTWYELFSRDEKVTTAIFDAAEVVARGTRIKMLDIGIHTLDEIDSVKRFHAVLENRILASLLDAEGRVAAQMMVSRAISVSARAGADVEVVTSSEL